MMELKQKLDFLKAIEGLKTVERRVSTSNPKRMESSAEHTLSSVIVARLFKAEIERDFPGIYFLKLLDMIMVHDLPEIYAGDVSLFDEEGRKLKAAEEIKAAQRLFPMLPQREAEYFHNLWEEYEAGKSQEAIVAKKIDFIDPMIQNIRSNGSGWKEHRVTIKMIKEKKAHMFEGSDVLSEAFRHLIEEIKEKNLTGEDLS